MSGCCQYHLRRLDEGVAATHLIRDHDTKFTEAFDQCFRGVWAEIVKTPFQTPIANCNFRGAESWIGTLKRECLNHFLCFSLRHLDFIVQIYVGYHNRFRPHRAAQS